MTTIKPLPQELSISDLCDLIELPNLIVDFNSFDLTPDISPDIVGKNDLNPQNEPFLQNTASKKGGLNLKTIPVSAFWFLPCPFCGKLPILDGDAGEIAALEGDEQEETAVEHVLGCENKACTVQPFVTGIDVNQLVKDWNKRA